MEQELLDIEIRKRLGSQPYRMNKVKSKFLLNALTNIQEHNKCG